MAITAQDIEAFIRQVDADPELKRALQERLVDAEAIQRALSDPAKRDEIRRIVLGDEWVDAPALLRELAATQREQAAILDKHTLQLAMLIETQQRHEAILKEHTELLARMDERQNRLEDLTYEIRDQVAGISGQHAGEVHERQTLRRAMSIFRGGAGGSPERPSVQRRLRQWLRPLYETDQIPGTQDDPSLSDIIWWKNGKVIVGEISVKVDRLDVIRAKQRARTPRKLGVDATPAVIGEEWAIDETRQLAQVEGVEWFVGRGGAQGLIEFRKLVDTEEYEESF